MARRKKRAEEVEESDSTLLGGMKLGGQEGSDDASSSSKTSRKPQDESYERMMRLVVDDIWDRIGRKEIDLDLCLAGQTYDGGRPIYDIDLMTTLLINYGYRIDFINAFEEEFSAAFDDEPPYPILMVGQGACKIYENVEHIEAVDKLMDGIRNV